MKIAFCQCTYYNDYDDTLKCVKRVSPHVDLVIIVEDGSLTDKQRNMLKSFPNMILKTAKFKDNIPEYRNQYLEEARRQGVNWVAVSDPDELYSESIVEDLRKIIDWAENNNYNMLGLNCREIFENIEWLDNLEKLKESPGNYRESNFWKQLIFKLYPDLKYEGVGKTRNVHETWRSSTPWRAINLPKKYYYEHRKTALKIWRNAARNLFISGGGDNVGDLNEMWVKLRQICNRLNINTWGRFEEYITTNTKLPEELVNWIKQALTWKATDYGVETRETAKWIIFHHRYLLENEEIKHGVENPPPPTVEDEVENYIRKTYFQILGRHPDREGLEFYKWKILNGEVKREDLPSLLATSPEHQEKFALTTEKVKVQVPVNVDIPLTEQIIIQTLMKSRKWFEEVKPKIDIGKLILDNVKNPEEFTKWFYQNKDKITLKELIGYLYHEIRRGET